MPNDGDAERRRCRTTEMPNDGNAERRETAAGPSERSEGPRRSCRCHSERSEGPTVRGEISTGTVGPSVATLPRDDRSIRSKASRRSGRPHRCRRWHLRRFDAVWHLRSLASPPFGISAVWHVRRVASPPSGDFRLKSFRPLTARTEVRRPPRLYDSLNFRPASSARLAFSIVHGESIDRGARVSGASGAIDNFPDRGKEA